MERFDVFVIGGGATGSEIAFRLGRHGGMAVGLAERDKLGGECNLYGCVPTKVMLRSAKIAALARDADRFGVRVPAVDVDFLAVRDRGDGIAPLLEELDVGPQEIDLVVGPQDAPSTFFGHCSRRIAFGTAAG